MIGILIFAAIVLISYRLVPPFVNNYQLQDSMVEEARFAGVQRKDAETIRDDVYKEVQKLGIPARREDIHVEYLSTGLRISMDYRVVVELPGYQLPLQFHPSADSNSI